ncbi:MAG TPA: SWIM zinc finger family protein [Bacteroidales bacterium]|nr:SWIM zinc finger family protein [Bacteroidales bacterium]
MQIPLKQFEQYIDETILKRGLSYFKNGHVHEPEEISPGEYDAIVEGTEDYTVQITLKNGIITEHVCDCPYDFGPVCKHVAAVIFYLQQDELELNKKTKRAKTDQTAKPAKRKTVARQVDELLEKATHDELKQFIRDKASANAPFRNLFLSSFAQYNSDESKELYVKQVKSILQTASDRHGFIDWSASRIVGNAVDNLLESAQKQINNRNYKSAVFICTAVMEQMSEALQYSDDSNGDIGGSVHAAYEMLFAIAQEQLPEEIRKLIIEYCFTSFDKQIYSGWDWHIGVLRFAAFLLKTEDEIDRIFKQIDKAQRSDYEREEAQSIKYDILLKTKGENAAEKYLEQNITNSNLRREAIQKELKKRNFEKAISLAEDGVSYDLKDRPGLAKEWYDWLLKIAQAQNDSEKIIEYARMLFIDNFRNEQDYYQILKQHVKPDKWNAFVEAVIQDITTKKRWPDTGLIASILINEEWWDRLLELVKKSPDLNTIDHYEKYLSKNYSDEIVELYTNGIIKYMKNSMGRDHYQNACRYIRKIIKIGARNKANEIISYLRTEYPKRKALMEELARI